MIGGYLLDHIFELPETAGSVTGLEFQPLNIGDKRSPLLIVTTEEIKTFYAYTITNWNQKETREGEYTGGSLNTVRLRENDKCRRNIVRLLRLRESESKICEMDIMK